MNCEEPTKVTEQPLSAGVWDRRLIVRAASPPEHERFDAQMRDHHYLGAGQPVGDYLRQVVERGGQPVALLAWGPACYALKDRDRWIGWSATTRVERLSLIVQNRRFLLLGAKGAEPNLASEVLAATARALPEQWLERFGYRPLLAETFTDPEAYHGACYKASAWEPVGASQGYERHRADFYREHGQPKRLWLRVLHPSAKALLRAADHALPEECRGGLRRAHAGALPGALALDAKFIRDAVGVLSLVEADTGAPVALAVVDQKQNTPRSEQARAGQLLATAPLDERIVTGDALHATREQARSIVERAGEYVLQIKGIQPHLDTWRVSITTATPSQADYPGLRSLALADKTTVRKRDGVQTCEQRAYASSFAPDQKCPAQLLALIRGRWGAWKSATTGGATPAGARIKPAPATSMPWPTSPSCPAPCCAFAPIIGPTCPCHGSSNPANTLRLLPSTHSTHAAKTKDHGPKSGPRMTGFHAIKFRTGKKPQTEAGVWKTGTTGEFTIDLARDRAIIPTSCGVLRLQFVRNEQITSPLESPLQAKAGPQFGVAIGLGFVRGPR